MRVSSIGIFWRVFGIVVLALGVMLISFAVVGIQAVQQSTDRTLEERRTLAHTIAGRVDDRLDQTIKTAQEVIGVRQRNAGLAAPIAQAQAPRELYERLDGFAFWVALLDSNRQLAAAYPPGQNVENFDFSNAKCLQVAMTERKPVISCAVDLGTPTPAIAMVVPILEGTQVNGAIFAALDLNSSHFADVLQTLGLGTTGYVQVIDGNGMILGSTRPAQIWQTDDHEGVIRDLITNQEAVVSTCHSCHTDGAAGTTRSEDIMAFAPLSSANWGVAVRQSRAEAFTFANELQRQIIFVGVATFVLAATVTWLLMRRLVQPLQGLTRACEEISAGNLGVEIPHNNVGEIGTLALAFSNMRDQLRASLHKIQNWTGELENRVYTRTRELEESRTETLRINRELAILNALGDALQHAVDLEMTTTAALEVVAHLGHVHNAAICLLVPGSEKLDPASFHSIHLGEDCSCSWEQVEPCIPPVLSTRRAQVVQAPMVLSAHSNVEPTESEHRHQIVCVPLYGKNGNLGVLILVNSNGHLFSASEINLLTSIGGQVGTAIENALLFEELKKKEETRTELLHKVIDAQEEERRRIACELHDETSQALTALNVGLKTAIMAPAETPDDVKRRLVPLKTQASGMLEEIRRMIRDLRPSMLDDLGLIPAIVGYAEARLKPQGIQVEWEVIGKEQRLAPELETVLFRVAQEAISNIARHAHAENVSIVLGFESDAIHLEVEDDGCGFDMASTLPPMRSNSAYGLIGMRERISLFDGDFKIESKLNEGTRILASIPIKYP